MCMPFTSNAFAIKVPLHFHHKIANWISKQIFKCIECTQLYFCINARPQHIKIAIMRQQNLVAYFYACGIKCSEWDKRHSVVSFIHL